MLGTDPFGLAGVRLLRDELVQPQVARRRERDVAAGPLVDDHVANALAAAHAERFIDDHLQRQMLAPTRLLVGGDDRNGAGVDDPLLQRLGREAAEDDRMRGADPCAGLHRDDAFDRHRDVDEDAVALLDPERLQAVGEPADAVVEVAIGDLGHRSVVGLENDRDLLGIAVRKIAIEAVVRDIELAVLEPFVERRLGLVERFRERLVPQDLVARVLCPEAGEVLGGVRVERVEVGLLDVGLRDEFARRLEDPGLGGYRLDRGHAGFSCWGPVGRAATLAGRSVTCESNQLPASRATHEG